MTHAKDAVHWYMGELSSRIVAESGIPGDRFHLGKMVLQGLKDAPEFDLQIDAATNESENCSSVLRRSIQCAEALKSLGLKKGDVIVLMGRNHLDLCIPLYAAFYLGLIVAALDGESVVEELENMLDSNRAKIIFCQGKRTHAVKSALENLKLESRVVSFDKGSDCVTFDKFLETFAVDVDAFKAENFDTTETVCFLTSTSGSTGFPKSAALTHKNMAISFPQMFSSYSKFPTPVKMAMIVSPLQWLSASIHYTLSPFMRYTRLQTSGVISVDHLYDIVNKYQPDMTIFSPPFLMSIIKPGNKEKGSLSCFQHIVCGGSALPQELVDQFREVSPKTLLSMFYGMSEVAGPAIRADDPIDATAGRAMAHFDYKLVDVETNEEITEPKVAGELWLKGPSVFKGYYNNPKATAEVLLEDGWLKTGDLFYRDEANAYYYVDRLKLLLKYKNHQISPMELETVIRRHPSVLDVAVTGLPDTYSGDLPVACVVRKKGHSVTAQEIKDLVKNTLTDTKQLRGGVIFMDELPLSVTHKLHRQKLKEIVLTVERE